MKSISSKTRGYIAEVAKDPELQKAILKALFNGCEVGTDIWEYFDEAKFTDRTYEVMYGLSRDNSEALDNAETSEEASMIDALTNYDAIYFDPERTKALFVAVEAAILEKLK